jgi:hypothetical protein
MNKYNNLVFQITAVFTKLFVCQTVSCSNSSCISHEREIAQLLLIMLQSWNSIQYIGPSVFICFSVHCWNPYVSHVCHFLSPSSISLSRKLLMRCSQTSSLPNLYFAYFIFATNLVSMSVKSNEEAKRPCMSNPHFRNRVENYCWYEAGKQAVDNGCEPGISPTQVRIVVADKQKYKGVVKLAVPCAIKCLRTRKIFFCWKWESYSWFGYLISKPRDIMWIPFW